MEIYSTNKEESCKIIKDLRKNCLEVWKNFDFIIKTSMLYVGHIILNSFFCIFYFYIKNLNLKEKNVPSLSWIR